ncbi:MAG: helix-turn-helix domain-containing protein [Anaerolineae bacterium]
MSPLETVVTVRDILTLALPEGTTVAGGSQGLDNRVEWVVALRAAFPIFGALNPGYLAIARLSLARALDSRITPTYLITELQRVKAAGLLVDEPLSADDRTVADKLALPTLCVPPGSDLYEVERSVLRTVIDREGQLSRREAEIRQQCLAAFERGGVAGLLTCAAETCAAQLRLCTPDGNCVAATQASGSFHQLEQQYPVTVAGRNHGQLYVRTAQDANDLITQIAIRQVADICGVALVELTARREAEERFGTELVEQLLNDKLDPTAITARLERLGLSLTPDRFTMAVALGTVNDTPALDNEQLASRLVGSGKQAGSQVILTRYHQLILILASLRARPPERWAHRWLQQALETAPTATRAGVGRCLQGLAGLCTTVKQAIDSLDLGKHLQDAAGPFFYDELGLYRLLIHLRGTDEMQRFYHETIGSLVEYDTRHKTDLLHTLAVFFEQNANASQASRALFVHRNTLNYRLQRIGEITGLNLEDPEARMAFQIALKIHQLAS